MKYIGNKSRLISFIENSLISSKIEFKNKKVADLFSGTGAVSNFFLRNNCSVFSCDNMTYSIAEQYRVNYYNEEPKFPELKQIINSENLDDVIKYLNNLEPVEDYFYNNYAPSGLYKRQYFSDINAKKIDSIRKKIEDWESVIGYDKFMFLNGILMCAADKVSNTSGTYGAFLKIWRSMATKPIILEKPIFSSEGKNFIFKSDVISFLDNNEYYDIVYLDPPYNKRQYASNFHVLENIVVFDKQHLRGITGLREYESQKSKFCIKKSVKEEFSNLFKKINSSYIIVSYSNEGLISEKEMLELLEERGSVSVYRNSYRRFKTNSWTDEKTGLEELLFVCVCN